MEVKYTDKQIEEVLQIINSLPFQSIESAAKVYRIYMILNEPFINKNVNQDITK